MEAIFEAYGCMKKRTMDLLKAVRFRSHQEEILDEFYDLQHVFQLSNDCEITFVARCETSPKDVEKTIDRELVRRKINKNDDLLWGIKKGLLKYECTLIQIRHFERKIAELKRKEVEMLQNMSFVFRGDDLSVEEVTDVDE